MLDGIDNIESALQFGYNLLVEKEQEAVKGFVDGRDVVLVLATVFGKSHCQE